MYDDDFMPKKRNSSRHDHLNFRLYHLQEDGLIFTYTSEQKYDETVSRSVGRRWHIWVTDDESEFDWTQSPDFVFTTREAEAWLKGVDHGRFSLTRSIADHLVVEAMQEVTG